MLIGYEHLNLLSLLNIQYELMIMIVAQSMTIDYDYINDKCNENIVINLIFFSIFLRMNL